MRRGYDATRDGYKSACEWMAELLRSVTIYPPATTKLLRGPR